MNSRLETRALIRAKLLPEPADQLECRPHKPRDPDLWYLALVCAGIAALVGCVGIAVWATS